MFSRWKRSLMVNRGRFMQLPLWALLSLPVCAHAEGIARGSACYTYGDSESVKSAREMARSMALRDAVESSGIFLSSQSAVHNFAAKEDHLKMISSGILRNIQVVEHREEGRKICETVEASFDPDRMEKDLRRAGEFEAERNASAARPLPASDFWADTGGIRSGVSRNRRGLGYTEDGKRVCAALAARVPSVRVGGGLKNVTPAGINGAHPFVRILHAWQESDSVIIKAECFRPNDRPYVAAPERHPANRVGITYYNDAGILEDLWVPVCGRKGEVRTFQFQLPECATLFGYWVGN